jgi:hypothetical protein
LDARAIAYASELCKAWTNRVSFIQANAARLRLSRRFDLVWSAGLFDYFNDRGFAHLLKRLAAHVRRDGGEVVIGNFSASNPTLAYQELCGDWHLNHRSAEVLVGIARQACGPSVEIAVEREPEGVNLFLRVRVVGDATSLTQGNAI